MSISAALTDDLRKLPRIAIIAGDAVTRRRLQDTLRVETLSEAEPDRADVLLLVCDAFGQPEADLVYSLRRGHPNGQVLVLYRSGDAPPVRSALAAGASGMILMDDVDVMLGAAIAAVATGLVCLPASYRRQMAKPNLTTREKQILGLVTMGLSNGEIGRKLYLAESTVKSHLSSSFNKLGVRSRNEATALIVDPNSGLGPGILRISQ